MSIEDLVMQIKAGYSSGMMDELYSQVKRLLGYVCNRYMGLAEMEDLEQEAVLGLYAAVDGYDPARGVEFAAYLIPCVKSRLLKFINANKSDTVSLETPISEDGEDLILEDTIASDEDLEYEACESVNNARLKAALWGEVDTLPDEQTVIIRTCYQDGKTLTEAGRATDMSYERARYSRDKALQTLGRSTRLRHLIEDSEVYSMGIRGVGVTRFNETWESATEAAALKMISDN